MHLTSVDVAFNLAPIRDQHAYASSPRPVVFCDMDGVVADFEATFMELYRCTQQEMRDYLDSEQGWYEVAKEHPDLFLKLAKMPGADTLMVTLMAMNRAGTINLRMLTALPGKWCDGANLRGYTDKRAWMWQHFGFDPAHVFIVRRSEKALYAEGCRQFRLHGILIDDLQENIDEWRSHGTGILHTNAEDSCRQLFDILTLTTWPTARFSPLDGSIPRP